MLKASAGRRPAQSAASVAKLEHNHYGPSGQSLSGPKKTESLFLRRSNIATVKALPLISRGSLLWLGALIGQFWMHEPSRIVGIPLDAELPVYMQDWFTDIAGRTEKTRRVIVFAADRPVGRLTIAIVRNGLGMKQGYNLPWARLCGLVFPERISENQRARIAHRLVRQLPTNVSYFLSLASKSRLRAVPLRRISASS